MGQLRAQKPCGGERRKRWICLRAFDFAARSNLARPLRLAGACSRRLAQRLSGTNLIVDGALTEAAPR
jgi:hypothetical protein